MSVQTPLDRVLLLWASTKLNGLLTREQQKEIVEEMLAKQRETGLQYVATHRRLETP